MEISVPWDETDEDLKLLVIATLWAKGFNPTNWTNEDKAIATHLFVGRSGFLLTPDQRRRGRELGLFA